MRIALIGLVTVMAALAADMQSSGGQESFYNQRFCTQGGGGREGNSSPDCAFNTWEQCIASARGLGRYCAENPFWHGPRAQPPIQRKSIKRNRRHY
jgi:Protein of unknown function (DUF3551)